jgi:hypothetical protein
MNFSGIAPSDEIERFLHKKMYFVKVEKMCSAYLQVEAENEQKAKELAENLKNHFVLDWK